ncbi:hypothetical protein [Flavobacterium sp.]|uniref:hypothetical protein n=1 Tax=Flavobacterium sp. TaxID=239 RepID=UPI0025ED89F0|nr:hypothetical protein [Flavobacterium sp.]
MIIDNLTNLLDNPITTVCLVATLGVLFVRIVWLPYKATTISTSKNNRYKKEVFLRLIELQVSFENQYSSKIIAYLLGGKAPINPNFKSWKLDALIYSGWSAYAVRNCRPTLHELQNLVEESNITIHKDNIKKGLVLVNSLTTYLRNLPEK